MTLGQRTAAQLRRVLAIETLDFYRVDLVRWSAPRLPRMRLDVVFRFGNEGDVARMAADERLDVQGTRDLYLEKLRRGDRLFLGIRGEETLFYLWVVSGEKSLMNRRLLLEPGEIAVERAFVRKDVRGLGLYVYGIDYLFTAEKERGTGSCLTEVARSNKPMIPNLRKCGFQRLDSGYFWISHPLGNHAVVFGPLRKRCRPKRPLAPRATPS